MNIDKNYNAKLNIVNEKPLEVPKPTSNANSTSKSYDSLVQFNNSYALAFMGKSSPKRTRLYTKDELEVKKSLDAIDKTIQRNCVETDEAMYNSCANSTDENNSRYEEISKKNRDFYNNKPLY